MAKYINPFTDWGFKRLFGQEFSKDLLISFLNDLFEGEFQVRDVSFKDKEQLADSRCLSKEEMGKYEESQRQVDNYNLGMYSAWLEGNEKGIKQGIEQGIEQGELAKSLDVAKNLLALGMPVSQIMQVTGLTKEQISSLLVK